MARGGGEEEEKEGWGKKSSKGEKGEGRKEEWHGGRGGN